MPGHSPSGVTSALEVHCTPVAMKWSSGHAALDPSHHSSESHSLCACTRQTIAHGLHCLRAYIPVSYAHRARYLSEFLIIEVSRSGKHGRDESGTEYSDSPLHERHAQLKAYEGAERT